MDDLDVIVVGGFFGGGHRSHMLSHFLCAVAVPPTAAGATAAAAGDTADGAHPQQFLTFCKVRTPSCSLQAKLIFMTLSMKLVLLV